jgi:hypothetical protein
MQLPPPAVVYPRFPTAFGHAQHSSTDPPWTDASENCGAVDCRDDILSFVLARPLTTTVGALAGVHVLLTVAARPPGKMALALSVFALVLAYIQLGDGARKLQRGVTGWEQHNAHRRTSGKTSNRVRRAEPAAIP